MIQFFNKKMSKKRKGFTLIELVVVIAILGILVALAIPRLTGARDDAAIATHNANVRMIESAIAIYQAQYGGSATISMEILENSDLIESQTIAVPSGAGTGNYSITGTAPDYSVTPVAQ